MPHHRYEEHVDPCPQCGRDIWTVHEDLSERKTVGVSYRAQTCSTCGLFVTPHWLDGCWMGMWWGAGKPGSLWDFREETAERLRAEYGDR